MDLSDNRVDSLDRLNLIKQIEELIACYQSQVVYVQHAGDVNVDHRRLHEAVITACRSYTPPAGVAAAQLRGTQQYGVAASLQVQSSSPLVCRNHSTLVPQTRSFVGLCQ